MYGTYLDKNPDGQFDMTVNKGDPAWRAHARWRA